MTLSVIIPVYDVAPYLRACLDSVAVAVDRVNICTEVLCVDDGSTDGSGAILDEYAAKDKRFKVIHQANAGVSAARNAALDVATGEWVMMLDGDDRWTEDLLVRLCEKIHETPDCDAVGFGMVKINESGKRLGAFGCASVSCITTGDEILFDGRGPMSHFIWSSCDKIYRRSVLEANVIRFAPNVRVGEDSLFAQEYFAQCGKVVLDSSIEGYEYLMRGQSAIHGLEVSVPHELFPKFRPLLSLWRRVGTNGLRQRLRLEAAVSPFVYREHRFSNGLSDAALEATLASDTFNGLIIPFMASYGTLKCRAFAIVYRLLPKSLRKRFIRILSR